MILNDAVVYGFLITHGVERTEVKFIVLIEEKVGNFFSNGERRGNILPLSVPYKGSTVDLAANKVLYHLPPMELKTRVYCVYTSSCQVVLPAIVNNNNNNRVHRSFLGT